MTDEEKKAIEELKNKKADYFMISDLTGKTLLNLINKQSKEIEELKEENKKYIVQLTDEQYRKLVDIIRSEISKEWQDKIKAKIEPVLKQLDIKMKEEYNKYGNSREYQDMVDAYNFLQSLLEKE